MTLTVVRHSPCRRRTSWWCRRTGCRGRWGTSPPPSQSWRRTWRWSRRCRRRRWSRRRSSAAPLISPPSADLRCTCDRRHTDEVRRGTRGLLCFDHIVLITWYLGNMLERSLSARVFSAVSWLVLSSTTSSKWFAYFSSFSTILSRILPWLQYRKSRVYIRNVTCSLPLIISLLCQQASWFSFALSC